MLTKVRYPRIMITRKITALSNLLLNGYNKFYPLLIIFCLAFLIRSGHASQSYRIPFFQLLAIIGLVVIAVTLDSIILARLFSPEKKLIEVFKSNLVKVIGGGLTQILLLSAQTNSIPSNFASRWKSLVSINFVASAPFLIFLIFNPIKFQGSNILLTSWFFFMLLVIFGNALSHSSRITLTSFLKLSPLAFTSQLSASIALLLCIGQVDFKILPFVVYMFLLSLIIPIPNGFLVRELYLYFMFSDLYAMRQVIIGSVLFRFVQFCIEFILGVGSYLWSILKRKKRSRSDIEK